VKFPKIELHVHLEGTVRAGTLLQIARRNGVPLPADSVEGLAALYEFRDFAHFLDVWLLTTGALRTERDFRQIVVDYAAEAASYGAVYLEGIFTPAEPVGRGVGWDEVFTGYCDGAQQAAELHGVQIRLTPDIPRSYPLEAAELTVRHAVTYRDRGVVGVGLGGPETEFPPEPYAGVFAVAREGGLGSVPHAGEVAGPASIRGALDALGADRIRHGIGLSTIPAWWPSWPVAAWCSTCARSRTCAPARSPRWPGTRCRRSWRPAFPARCRPTTRLCSGLTWPPTTRQPGSSGYPHGTATWPGCVVRCATGRPGTRSSRPARRSTGPG
jgi:Adenosine deaminase